MTLPTYAMTLAILVTSVLGGLQVIVSGSGTLLTDSGDSIGDAPPSRVEAVEQPLTAPGGWVRANQPADPAPTFSDRRLSPDGLLCVGPGSGSGLALVACTDSSALLFTLQPRGRGGLELLVSGGCVTSETGPLTIGLCGTPRSDWSLNSSAGNPLVLAQTHPASGSETKVCLTVPAGLVVGSDLALGPCSAKQTVSPL